MKRLLLVLVSLSATCTPSRGIVSRDVEARVTVTHGVYGQTVIWNDSDDGPYALVDYEFDVTATNATSPAPVISDDVGFYQLELDAGSYRICTAWSDCGTFTVPATGVVRFDYDGSSALGWHDVTVPGGPDAGT
jgi:hypothetical protein